MDLMYLLQAATSAFPTGAFSHSFGFESLIAEGDVDDPESLEQAARLWLRYGVARADAAVCALAWRATSSDPIDAGFLMRLDEELGALRITRETRQASLSTGNAFLKAALDAFGGKRSEQYRALVQSGSCTGHYATAFGVATADAGIGLQAAVVAFLHGAFSSLVAVSARIIPLGQIATQRIIAQARPEIFACAQSAMSITLERLGTSTAGFDLASMAHEQLYSRLCIS